MIETEKTNYGNWIPRTFMTLCYSAVALLLAIELGLFFASVGTVVLWLVGVVLLLALLFTLYMQVCRWLFSFTGRGLMGKFHEYLLAHLDWDGHGQMLDIGCGAAALTVRCAHTYPQAQITGIDYWGIGWNYAKEQCERNAAIEGVGEQTVFRKGDAAKLDFADGTFDAAVSNFVFHEVRTQPDKHLVIREALRVVRSGGSFAFLDLFGQKQLYGDMTAFVAQLRKEGISEIHYIANVEKQPFMPAFLRTPWMMYGVGLIYGKK
ncbi:class I SAM-dependent methyltransferase [Tannerella forsythia]|mgnify:FL=1|jgi:methyltransferase domain protein|uniref:Demethylrebeccamycin-D-glucose O-methyltransferase n=1 Tax=Tannerella forsythia TaxID=28112 RepID=A0A1D3UMU0_TANFO|nr:class I SAM-dependent methyltransferase [Tannerella forsythia]SCQ21470.1 Demethylrebeccamycin-D-glucose O-methyltransferase [Tannerella forsythia]SCQ22266.1 Demethylrebeccamycin-D-glucose O-methyltransferase [Tannerella forsythia]